MGKNRRYDEFVQKIKLFVKVHGYRFIRFEFMDYGLTTKAIVSKAKKIHVLPIRELFYDTDNEGNMTDYHGVIDITESILFQEFELNLTQQGLKVA